MRWNNEGLQQLQEELDRTAVISKEFKSLIMNLASHAVAVGYERGKEAARPAGESNAAE